MKEKYIKVTSWEDHDVGLDWTAEIVEEKGEDIGDEDSDVCIFYLTAKEYEEWLYNRDLEDYDGVLQEMKGS